MKIALMGIAIAATVVLLAACTAPSPAESSSEVPQNLGDSSMSSQSEAYHKISVEEAKKMMDKGEVVIVDVRTQEEYDAAHIPSAVVVPVESIGDEMPSELPDKEAMLLVYCRTGVRSKSASEKLVGLGYQNVYDFGGIVDWPYETVKGEE